MEYEAQASRSRFKQSRQVLAHDLALAEFEQVHPARCDALVAKLAARGVDTSALQPVPQVAPAAD